MQALTKHVFHCVICGRVLHVNNESGQQICCGQSMHHAFKESVVSLGRDHFDSEPYSSESDEDEPSVQHLLAKRSRA